MMKHMSNRGNLRFCQTAKGSYSGGAIFSSCQKISLLLLVVAMSAMSLVGQNGK